nr:hypothetical protein [Alysiella crassa]
MAGIFLNYFVFIEFIFGGNVAFGGSGCLKVCDKNNDLVRGTHPT